MDDFLILQGIQLQIEPLFFIKCIFLVIFFYLITNKEDEALKSRIPVDLGIIFFIMNYVMVYLFIALFFNLSNQYIGLISFLFFIIFYMLKKFRFSVMNFLVAITVSFALLTMQMISNTLAIVITSLIGNAAVNNAPVIFVLEVSILCYLVFLFNKFNFFEPLLIKSMLKNKLIAASQILLWTVSMFLYFLGEQMPDKLYLNIGFILILLIFTAICIAVVPVQNDRQKRIEKDRDLMTLIISREICNIINTTIFDKFMRKEYNGRTLIPRKLDRFESPEEITKRQKSICRKRLYEEYLGAAVKISEHLDNNGMQFGSKQFYDTRNIMFAYYYKVRTYDLFEQDNISYENLLNESLFSYKFKIHNNKKEDLDDNKIALIDVRIRKSIKKMIKKSDYKTKINSTKPLDINSDIINEFLINFSNKLIEDRKNIPRLGSPYFQPERPLIMFEFPKEYL